MQRHNWVCGVSLAFLCLPSPLRTSGRLQLQKTQAYFTASSQTQPEFQFEAVSPRQACQPTCKSIRMTVLLSSSQALSRGKFCYLFLTASTVRYVAGVQQTSAVVTFVFLLKLVTQEKKTERNLYNLVVMMGSNCKITNFTGDQKACQRSVGS